MGADTCTAETQAQKCGEYPPPANLAECRDALMWILDLADSRASDTSADPRTALCMIRDKAAAALSRPPRQCDVGTADEQFARYAEFCRGYPYCNGCPVADVHRPDGPIKSRAACALTWGQAVHGKEAK